MKFIRTGVRFFPFAPFLLTFILCLSCRKNAPDNPDTQKSASQNELAVLDTVVLLRDAASFFRKGEQFQDKKLADSALAYHQKALDLRIKAGVHNQDLVESYFEVGRKYLEDFKYDVADPYLEKARLLAGQNKQTDPKLLIEIYLRSMDCKSNLKDIPSALSLVARAESLVNQLLPHDRALLSRTYHFYANCYYYNQQYDRSIEFMKKSIAYIDPSNHARLAVAFDAIALSYKESRQYAQALNSFNRAITENLKWTDKDSDPLAIVYLQKAFVLLELSQKDSAQYYLRRNLEIRQKVYGNKSPEAFGAILALADMEFANGDYASAARDYHTSLISLIKNFDDPKLSANPEPGATEMNNDIIMGLTGKAKSLRRVSLRGLDSDGMKAISLKTYLLADSIFSVFRNTSNYDDPVLRQLETSYIHYEEMVELAFDLFVTTHREKYLQLAMNIMERSRAILLQTTLQKAEAFNLMGSEGSKQLQEKRLTQKRAELVRNLNTKGNSQSVLDSLNNALLSLDEEVLQLREELRVSDPRYFSGRVQPPSVKLQELQQFLGRQNAMLLEYLWSDSTVYLLSVTADTVTPIVIRQTPEFRSAFHNFTAEMKVGEESTIKRERFARFCGSAYQLYHDLLGGTLQRVPLNARLIISADGPLSILPFEALIKKGPGDDEVNYHLDYLVLDYSVAYTYSSSLLLRQADRKRHGNKLLAFGFAGEGLTGQTRNLLVNLPGTELELSAIREVMKNHTNQYYLERNASEWMFKKNIRDFNIAHLALHGISDTLNALESRIIFREEDDSVEDGQLFAHELYDLDLNKLDLAVLSACESGIGKQQTGEGLMSMARGFAYAGCPSLVTSLWKLDDKTSAEVMGNFYRHLSEKEHIDVSLVNAKRDYLSNASEFKSHPSYWAAFILVGNSEALDVKGPRIAWWVVAGVLLSCGAAFLFFFYRKGN